MRAARFSLINAMMAAESILFAVAIFVQFVSGKKYTFEVSMQYRSPDCVERPITLVNGLFPGPTINVTSGETLEVEVSTNLSLPCLWPLQMQIERA